MKVIAWPGIILIRRGVKPFHNAAIPSSLAIREHACVILEYYTTQTTDITFFRESNEK